MSGVIEVQDLKKHYGQVRAVDGVDLSVRQGEFFGILGPNGAGKTTTLEMIEGLRPHDSGTIRVLGENPWPRNARLLPRIGVQLQASSFFDRLTCSEQLGTFAELYAVSRGRVGEMLAAVGLEDKAGVPVEKLSGGQKQRLSIACSLVHDPEVVFLDEPTAALDPQARRNLWEVLRKINAEGRTVVLTTHYMDEAEILCDRVAIMDTGKVLSCDTPAAMVRGLAAPTRISLPEGQLTADDLSRLVGAQVTADNGSLTFETQDPSAALTSLGQQDLLSGLQVRGATLEDVFLNLTGREYRA